MAHRAIAAVVVIVALVAGCASQGKAHGKAQGKAQGKPSGSAPIGSSGPRPSAATVASSSSASAEHNKQAAEDEAKRLLAVAPRPPGATSVAAAPKGLSGPAMGVPMTRSLVDQAEFWSVPMSLDASIAWLRAHQPAGMANLGESSGSGPGLSYKGVGWAPSHDAQIDPGVTGPSLQVTVAAVDPQSSSWRVDAIDTWLDPVPFRDSAAGPRMRVTLASGCPSTDNGVVGVSNDGADLDAALLPAGSPTAGLICDYNGMNGKAFALTKSVRLSSSDAARLATAVNASQLSHLDNATTSCPMDDESLAVLVFSYRGRPDVDVAYFYTGCATVANGHILATPGDALPALVDPRATSASPSP